MKKWKCHKVLLLYLLIYFTGKVMFKTLRCYVTIKTFCTPIYEISIVTKFSLKIKITFFEIFVSPITYNSNKHVHIGHNLYRRIMSYKQNKYISTDGKIIKVYYLAFLVASIAWRKTIWSTYSKPCVSSNTSAILTHPFWVHSLIS